MADGSSGRITPPTFHTSDPVATLRRRERMAWDGGYDTVCVLPVSRFAQSYGSIPTDELQLTQALISEKGSSSLEDFTPGTTLPG